MTIPVLTGAADGHGQSGWIAVFGVLAVVPLLFRRQSPTAAVAGVAAVLAVAALADVRFTPWVSNAGPALAVAVFALADRTPRRVSLLVAGVTLLCLNVVSVVAVVGEQSQDQDAVQLILAAAAWLAGDAARTRRGYRVSLQEEARREEKEREARIRAEERLRVSRDVHDLISHTLSMIAVRSGVARLLLAEQPEEAGLALASIETASRSALNELRQVLTHLRDAGADAELAELAEPSIQDITALVDAVRAGGIEIEYRRVGEPGDYSPLLETSVYRIVQEALTNVVKHSGAHRVDIEVDCGTNAVTVRVVDDGTGASGGVDGLGVLGMRERTALFGGSVEVGPAAEGRGFAVRAELPVSDPLAHD